MIKLLKITRSAVLLSSAALLGILTVCIVPARGATTGLSPAAAPAGAAALAPATPALVAPLPGDNETYKLEPGDVLSISVVNFPNLNEDEVTVPPDGLITPFLLKPIPVLGKTTDQIATILATMWQKYVIKPAVTVMLKEKHSQDVMFYGYVTHPGTAPYIPNLHVLQGLAEAGGALPEGDLTQVAITHKDGAKQVVDLSHPGLKGGSSSDVVLQEEDYVYVPQSHMQYTVVGQVKTPGSFPFLDQETVLDALDQAGGVLQTADLKAATLSHNGKDQPLNLDALLKHGDLSVNTQLSPGDTILVPLDLKRVYAFGDVTRPGYNMYQDGDRVLDALSAVGLNTDAETNKVNVVHVNNQTKTAVLQIVNLQDFLWHGKLDGNPLLQPGDVIYIPKRTVPFSIESLVYGLAGVRIVDGINQVAP